VIRNTTTGVNPLLIDGNSSSNGDTLVISAAGNLGLGAYPPDDILSARLFISDPTPEIELADSDQNRTWQLFADGGNGGSDPLGGVGLADVTALTNPFYIVSAAPTDSFFMDTTGYVGLGTDAPGVRLQVQGDSIAPVEELFRLESTTSPQQVFVNSTSNAKWFFAMTRNDTFKVSFDGTGKVEARFFQNGNLQIAGALTQNSDRNSKQNINEIDGKDVLQKLVELPISTWEYKADQGIRHLGPMAQDFYAAFGLGQSPTGISTIDTGGVALAAIKGLKQENDHRFDQLKSENHALAGKNEELEVQLREQDERVVQLEMALAELLRKNDQGVQVGSIK
jgi:hypothetical protein